MFLIKVLINNQSIGRMSFRGRDIVIGAIFSGLGVVFPIMFHLVGLGSVFLPMFLPVVTAGFLVSFPVAFSIGLVTPLFSSVITGMPPIFPPVAPVMCIELSILTGCASLFYRNLRWNIWISLVCAIVFSRTVYLVIILLIVPLMKLPPGVLTIAAAISGIPGIILMIAVVPPAVKMVEKKFQFF